MASRLGNQIPTLSRKQKYKKSHGKEAVELYAATGRELMKWQSDAIDAILAYDNDGLWVHAKVGYSVPRRNGKSEILVDRELYGLVEVGEKILHTAHRTTTSHASSVKLSQALDALGYHEVQRVSKGKEYEKSYTYSKQYGLERIVLLDTGGSVDFRTRSGKGGLGEGFDLLIVDEAQEYTVDQESALKYVISDSQNPQYILCGTPPTAVSSGTVFPALRDGIIAGTEPDSMWFEWGIEQVSDVNDVELWYRANPSLGVILTERKIRAEIGPDTIDFNIQRLGVWIKYNQASAISENDWMRLKVDSVPDRTNTKLCVGVKFGVDGTNVALAVAFKTADGKVFVEAIDCRSMRTGFDWIVKFCAGSSPAAIVIDGANGQELLEKALKNAGVKVKPIFPTTKEYVVANADFERMIYGEELCHMAQPALVQIVSNCSHRAIGTAGGYGFKALKPDMEIALMDSVILASWATSTIKATKKQSVHY